MAKTLKQSKAAQKLIAIGAAACIATAAMAYAPADSLLLPMTQWLTPKRSKSLAMVMALLVRLTWLSTKLPIQARPPNSL